MSAWAVNAFERLAREAHATLTMALVSALGVLLHARSERSHIEIGLVNANRDRSETEDVIGYVAGVIPIPVDIADGFSFIDVLRQVRDTALARYRAQASMSTLFPPWMRKGPDAVPAACEVLLNFIPRDYGADAADASSQLSFRQYSPGRWRSVLDGATEWEFSALDFTLAPLAKPGSGAAGTEADVGLSGRLGFNAGAIAPGAARALATDFARLLRLLALRPESPVGGVADRLTSLAGALPADGLAWTKTDPELLVRDPLPSAPSVRGFGRSPALGA